MDAEAVAAQLRERLDADPRVRAAWLFGSVARGTATEGSDVDVAVFGTPVPRGIDDSVIPLGNDLTAALGRTVDVVRVEDASPDLVVRVLRDGMLLVDRDPAARIRFEVDTRNRYFDMQPIWRAYRSPRTT